MTAPFLDPEIRFRPRRKSGLCAGAAEAAAHGGRERFRRRILDGDAERRTA